MVIDIKRPTPFQVWLALVALTGATTLVFETDIQYSWATPLIILIASAKAGLILTWFMELRSAQRALQVAGALWLMAATAIMLIGFNAM
jgi:caa(3)-type oxidase subunit IV